MIHKSWTTTDIITYIKCKRDYPLLQTFYIHENISHHAPDARAQFLHSFLKEFLDTKHHLQNDYLDAKEKGRLDELLFLEDMFIKIHKQTPD